MPLIDRELHQLANCTMRRERAGLGMAARVVRHVFVDPARRRRRGKGGGGLPVVTRDERLVDADVPRNGWRSTTRWLRSRQSTNGRRAASSSRTSSGSPRSRACSAST
jgi:hypothetical protein